MTPEQFLQKLREWHDFYLLAGTAAATLLGLLFVAVTLNADLILAGKRPHIKRVAEQAFQNYIAVLLTALLFVSPGQGRRTLAVTLLAEAASMGLWAAYRLARVFRVSDESFSTARTWRRLLPSLLGYVVMIVAGWQMREAFEDDMLRLFSFAVMLLLISATGTSWDLLVRVAEIRHSRATSSELK
jgi:hypothetical protein